MEVLVIQKLTEQEWLILIKDWENSNKSIKDWCISKKVSENAFYYWRRRFNNYESNSTVESNSSGEWISLEQTPIANTPIIKPMNTHITINFLNFNIQINQGFDKNLLAELIKTLLPLC